MYTGIVLIRGFAFYVLLEESKHFQSQQQHLPQTRSQRVKILLTLKKLFFFIGAVSPLTSGAASPQQVAACCCFPAYSAALPQNNKKALLGIEPRSTGSEPGVLAIIR